METRCQAPTPSQTTISSYPLLSDVLLNHLLPSLREAPTVLRQFWPGWQGEMPMRMVHLGRLWAQCAPYLVLDIIFRGPFSDMGGKDGVKLDPDAEGPLALPWAAAGTACKSGATYHRVNRSVVVCSKKYTGRPLKNLCTGTATTFSSKQSCW